NRDFPIHETVRPSGHGNRKIVAGETFAAARAWIDLVLDQDRQRPAAEARTESSFFLVAELPHPPRPGLLFRGGNLARHPRRRGSTTTGIRKHVEVGQRQGPKKSQRMLEIVIGFARKPDDDVASDG